MNLSAVALSWYLIAAEFQSVPSKLWFWILIPLLILMLVMLFRWLAPKQEDEKLAGKRDSPANRPLTSVDLTSEKTETSSVQSLPDESSTQGIGAPSAEKSKEVVQPLEEQFAQAMVEAKSEELRNDDLTRIEGIGPKISAVLKAAGITTFARLAELDSTNIADLLKQAGIRLADPTTWTEQAHLAALGLWDELERLQNSLKGGRKV